MAPIMFNIPVIDFLQHTISLDTLNILQTRAISMAESLPYGRFWPLMLLASGEKAPAVLIAYICINEEPAFRAVACKLKILASFEFLGI